MTIRQFAFVVATLSASIVARPIAAQQHDMMAGMGHDMKPQTGQMQEIRRQMDDLTQRTGDMKQHLQLQMDAMAGAPMSPGHHAMHQAVGHLDAMAQQMSGLADQMEAMMKDPDMMNQPAMQRDMTVMRQHATTLSGDMGKIVRTMEQVQQRMTTMDHPVKKP